MGELFWLVAVLVLGILFFGGFWDHILLLSPKNMYFILSKPMDGLGYKAIILGTLDVQISEVAKALVAGFGSFCRLGVLFVGALVV